MPCKFGTRKNNSLITNAEDARTPESESIRIDRSRGKAYLIDGDLFYSPNSHRDILRVPLNKTKNDIVRNPFVRDHQYPKLSIVQMPRWWSPAFGWMSFIPLNPDFNHVPFDRLRIIPTELTRTENEFGLDEETMHSWLKLQKFLYSVTCSLNSRYKVTVIRPHFPSAYNFTSLHNSNRKARQKLAQARDWFVVWMAIVSYLMAVDDAEGRQTSSSDFDRVPSWYEILTKDGYDEIWLNGLRSSWLYDFGPRAQRAGTFLNVLEREHTQPSVSWFCEHHVDVWYRWSQMEAKISHVDKEIGALAPLPHQIQEALTLLHRMPTSEETWALVTFPDQVQIAIARMSEASAQQECSPPGAELHSTPIQANTILPQSMFTRGWKIANDKSPDNAMPACLLNFFASREAMHDLLLASETKAHRDARLQRQIQPPLVSARVYVWEEDDSHPDGWVRRAIPKRFRVETLNFFMDSQKRYDAWENEWDCFDSMGGEIPDEYDENFHETNDSVECPFTSDDDLLGNPGKDVCDVEEDMNEMVETRRSPSPPPLGSDSWELDDPFYPLEASEVLYLFHGFVQPLPMLNAKPSEVDTTEKNKFFRALGFRCTDDPIFSSQGGITAFQFIKTLATSPDLPNQEEWDLKAGNRIVLAAQSRVRLVKRIDNGWFLLNNVCKSVPWTLAVEEPSIAAYICRLQSNLSTYEIAWHLIQRGIQFHTMLEASSTFITKEKCYRPMPIRLRGYVFSRRDYDAYTRERQEILNTPRGRAALLRGGIVWRLALDTMSPDSALRGPSWEASVEGCGLCVKSGESIMYDDSLSQDELDIICGVYRCETGVHLLI